MDKIAKALGGGEGGDSGGGSSNLVFDLANAKQPEIDGVEYDAVYVDVEGKATQWSGCFCYDFSNNSYPAIIKYEDEGLICFDHIRYAEPATPVAAASESLNGELLAALIEDTECVLLTAAERQYYFFPTTAKFGYKQIAGGR